VYMEDLKPAVSNEIDQSINPSQLQVVRRPPPPPSNFGPQGTTAEEGICLNRVSLSRTHARIELPSNFKFPSEPEAQASQKGQEKFKFICTHCKRGFNRKHIGLVCSESRPRYRHLDGLVCSVALLKQLVMTWLLILSMTTRSMYVRVRSSRPGLFTGKIS
jgi:hypothetical protein